MRTSSVAPGIAILAVLSQACGSETRGWVLAELGNESGAGDVGCSLCEGQIVLEGASATEQHGSLTSGTLYTDICPGSQALIGYAGTVIDFVQADGSILSLIGSLQGFCGELGFSAGGRMTVLPGAALPLRGRSGDVATWSQMCPGDSVVVRFDGHSGIALDQVAFTCASWVAPLSDAGRELSIDVTTTLPAAGGTGGGAFQDGCPFGQMARGQAVRSGSWIDAFGLVCATPLSM
jgi:hypothetical protein